MIHSINSSADSFLADLARLQDRSEEAQRQLSSGLRVSKASDDPDQVGAILQTSSDIARNEQIGRNLDRVKSEADGSEQSLSTAILALEKVAVLGAQGANFDQSAAARIGLAGEVQNYLERLVAAANSSVEGRFVFSGDSDQVPAYSIDLTSPTGTTSYAGAAATRLVQDPRGGTFSTSQSAQQIFDAPQASVFAAVNALRVALLANDEPGITASLGALQTAHDHLSDSLSFYGTVQGQVADAINAGRTLALRLSTDLSSLRDADLVEATSELVNTKYNLDAALSARAKIPRNSLFDFLG
jgi:flagellar hook-associated protein 3 FlgL